MNLRLVLSLATILTSIGTLAWAQAAPPTNVLVCDMAGFQPAAGISIGNTGAGLAVEWTGAGEEQLRLLFAAPDGTPTIAELALRRDGGSWMTVARDAGFEFTIVEGIRRISNQQLSPLRGLGVELTSEIVDRYKWDVFWDAPLDLSTEVRTGNPPPADGVAHQPGLPRSADELRRGEAQFAATSCSVTSTGGRASIVFDGLTLGSFEGALVVTVYRGTNLIRAEVAASTELPSVAYKYDVGLTGLTLAPTGEVQWRDLSGARQSYGFGGPPNDGQVVLRAMNRLVVAETDRAAIAAFPPPHTFFWAREVEIVVGNNWYRKDDASTFSFGIRQGEAEVVDRYRANWSLYSAPPGSVQRMAGYFYPTLGGADGAFESALAFTNGDVYPALEGFQVMGSHYHTDVGRRLLESGNMDTRLPDFEALRAAGINIAGPVDRPRDPTQLEELNALFEGARKHSDGTFVVMPQMENSNLLGGHWDLLFSHPVYYVDSRPEGTPLVTLHPEYGRMYNIGSPEDIMAMVEAEDMLIFMPHPRTKGSTGYPDAVAESPAFLNDRYRGAGWRWGMGSDLSERRLSDKRVIPLLDDMNNWIADTDLRPKYLLAITETYAKEPGDDIYANGPVTYLRLDSLPEPGDYSSIVDVLESGDYFVTSGEVLIPTVQIDGAGSEAIAMVEVSWTFPLDFVEVVTGDGEITNSWSVQTTDREAFGSATFRIPFNATDQAWVRVAAWDSAGNGAMTMPVRLD
jgi:hypothetical protein